MKTGEDYSNKTESNWPLRYGSIMVMTDQDVDGSHIKGLVMNWLETFWPSLLEIDGFMTSMQTPIVKARKGKMIKSFYTLTDYENWQKTIKDIKKWNIKYYKGLGTSTSAEAKEYFKQLKMVKYISNKDEDIKALHLAFSKNENSSNDRKKWLKLYNKNYVITYAEKKVQYKDFINKELIHFSNDDVSRSIPSMIDGLKPSQRKILFSAFKRKLYKGLHY